MESPRICSAAGPGAPQLGSCLAVGVPHRAEAPAPGLGDVFGTDDFLPPVLTGETLYSLCARIAHGLRCSPAAASCWLLGHARGARQQDVIYGLARLESLYGGPGGRLAIDEAAVRTRTVLGGVMPFMPPEHRRLILEATRQSKPLLSARQKLGLRRGQPMMGLVLRRCPDCASADILGVGFAYWHAAHQYAGIWVCPCHGRPLQWLPEKTAKTKTWEVAQRGESDFQEISAGARALHLLHLVAASVLWCTSRASIGPASLAAMIRSRLRACGLLRREGSASDLEQRRIHESVAAPLARQGFPHFQRFTSCDWVGKTLSFAEFSHPLRWAVLIATTLDAAVKLPAVREDAWHLCAVCAFDGPISYGGRLCADLDADYAAAQQRVAQVELFPERRGARLRLAPEALYGALGQGLRLGKAAELVGLSLPQVSTWVQKDKALATHWRESIARLRTEDARARLEGYLRSNPHALRSTVLREQVAAVRSLERYAPELLRDLLPPPQPEFTRQTLLPFNSR